MAKNTTRLFIPLQKGQTDPIWPLHLKSPGHLVSRAAIFVQLSFSNLVFPQSNDFSTTQHKEHNKTSLDLTSHCPSLLHMPCTKPAHFCCYFINSTFIWRSREKQLFKLYIKKHIGSCFVGNSLARNHICAQGEAKKTPTVLIRQRSQYSRDHQVRLCIYWAHPEGLSSRQYSAGWYFWFSMRKKNLGAQRALYRQYSTRALSHVLNAPFPFFFHRVLSGLTSGWCIIQNMKQANTKYPLDTTQPPISHKSSGTALPRAAPG